MPLAAGQIVYEDDLDDLQPVEKPKSGSTGRVNTTTLQDDPDLSGLTLDPGDYDVEIAIFSTTSGTAVTSTSPRLKTRWAFTGSWSGGMRSCHGPGSQNTTAGADQVTTVTVRGYDATTQDAVYNFGVTSAYTSIVEKARITVTATGDLSLQWAQQTANANTTVNVNPGSYIKATKVTS